MIKSVNPSTDRGVGGVVLDPDQRHFSGNAEGLQMTASSRLNSHADSNKIDETRGITTVEGSDLSVDEGNIDRLLQTH